MPATSCPASTSSGTRRTPITPVAPARKIRKALDLLERLYHHHEHGNEDQHRGDDPDGAQTGRHRFVLGAQFDLAGARRGDVTLSQLGRLALGGGEERATDTE